MKCQYLTSEKIQQSIDNYGASWFLPLPPAQDSSRLDQHDLRAVMVYLLMGPSAARVGGQAVAVDLIDPIERSIKPA